MSRSQQSMHVRKFPINIQSPLVLNGFRIWCWLCWFGQVFQTFFKFI